MSQHGVPRTRAAGAELELGAAVVELLLPHRRPFLMVDRIEGFRLLPTPSLEASRQISMNEIFFAGHFPGLPIWPGALTMEGLGQTANLLMVLRTLGQDAEARGETLETLIGALLNLDRGFRMHPGHKPDDVPPLLDSLQSHASEIAVGAAVEMKFLRPVLPGCQLRYAVEVTADLGDRVRFGAVATVDGEPVARGTITAARGIRGHPARGV